MTLNYRSKKDFVPRTNEKIRAHEVQGINNYGENLGTLPTKEAIEIANTVPIVKGISFDKEKGTYTLRKITNLKDNNNFVSWIKK